jgi:DNA invertase Pin-like site-specific DNA recombinase
MHAEKQSRVKTDRAALARVLAALESGDMLMVTRLDRLARSTTDLLNVLARLRNAEQALGHSPIHGQTPPRPGCL